MAYTAGEEKPADTSCRSAQESCNRVEPSQVVLPVLQTQLQNIMKKHLFITGAVLCCLASTLRLGIAQAQPYPWPNNNAPFGTNGNVIYNWSFELPGTVKIPIGFDTVPGWFGGVAVQNGDSGIQGGNPPNAVEASYDGIWDAYTKASDGCHAKQTTGYIIQQGNCFQVSVASKNEWVLTPSFTHTDGYLSVALYYGGTSNTEGTLFFTNTFVIHPAPNPSHTNQLDWTNYFFGVITNSVPAAAIGQPLGIDIWQSTAQYNPAADPNFSWLDFDGVVVIPTNGIVPTISLPVISPTNLVWGGETLILSASAFGSLPLAWQWQTDGGGGGALTNIPGANLTNLVVVTPTNAGIYSYDVVVANDFGSATSAVVSFTVWGRTAPFVTQDTGTLENGPITNIFAFIGGTVNFSATFDGSPPITNQWLFDNGTGYAPIAGATSNSLAVTNVQLSSANISWRLPMPTVIQKAHRRISRLWPIRERQLPSAFMPIASIRTIPGLTGGSRKRTTPWPVPCRLMITVAIILMPLMAPTVLTVVKTPPTANRGRWVLFIPVLKTPTRARDS